MTGLRSKEIWLGLTDIVLVVCAWTSLILARPLADGVYDIPTLIGLLITAAPISIVVLGMSLLAPVVVGLGRSRALAVSVAMALFAGAILVAGDHVLTYMNYVRSTGALPAPLLLTHIAEGLSVVGIALLAAALSFKLAEN